MQGDLTPSIEQDRRAWKEGGRGTEERDSLQATKEAKAARSREQTPCGDSAVEQFTPQPKHDAHFLTSGPKFDGAFVILPTTIVAGDNCLGMIFRPEGASVYLWSSPHSVQKNFGGIVEAT